MPSYGSELIANEIYPVLIGTEDFDFPDIDLSGIDIPDYDPITGQVPQIIQVEDLTTGVINGSGVFDKLVSSINAHIGKQFDAGRITAKEYADVYVQLMSAALATATSFLLQKDNNYWQALATMQQARLTEAQIFQVKGALALTKIQAAQAKIEAHTASAQYALTKLKLATEDAAHEVAKAQLATAASQKLQIEAQTVGITYNNTDILPTQKAGLLVDNSTKSYNLSEILPTQKSLLLEQVEVQRAQTRDTHVDGSNVIGLVGKQKELYAQQITSYKRDAEVKAGKLFTDAWITMKTLDEGLSAPTGFTNASLDQVLTAIKANNDLD